MNSRTLHEHFLKVFKVIGLPEVYNNSYSIHLGDVRFVYFHFKDGGFESIFLTLL